MASHDLPKPDLVRNMRLIGSSGQQGCPEGIQIMVSAVLAFVCHKFSRFRRDRGPRTAPPRAGLVFGGSCEHVGHPSPAVYRSSAPDQCQSCLRQANYGTRTRPTRSNCTSVCTTNKLTASVPSMDSLRAGLRRLEAGRARQTGCFVAQFTGIASSAIVGFMFRRSSTALSIVFR